MSTPKSGEKRKAEPYRATKKEWQKKPRLEGGVGKKPVNGSGGDGEAKNGDSPYEKGELYMADKEYTDTNRLF